MNGLRDYLSGNNDGPGGTTMGYDNNDDKHPDAPLVTEQPQKLELRFGRRTYPDDVKAVWGARWIAPSDQLWDRQDLAYHDEDAKTELVAWLNGPGMGNGAISKAQEKSRELRIAGNDEAEHVLYEDEIGKVVGSAQGSHGYIYVCAWLKAHTGS